LATMENPHVYQKYIILNNDRQNEVQGIMVKGFSNELLTRRTDQTNNKSYTVSDYLTSHRAIISIQETHQTTDYGKYMFIVSKSLFQEARKIINDLCENKFHRIYITQEQRDAYRVSYKALPHIANGPTAGGAAANHGAHLVAMMAEEEKKNGKAFSSINNDTWASKASMHLTFDKNSRHPIAKQAARTTVSNTTSSNATIIIPSTTVTDINSVNSQQSGSTLAIATQATPSGRTN
jgi:hypothetical protein